MHASAIGSRGVRLARDMSSILLVHESASERVEIAYALEGEGFHVTAAASASEAVREVWGGNFLLAIVSASLTGTTSAALVRQLRDLAPEIETVTMAKQDDARSLARKAVAIRDGNAAA